MRLRQIYLGEYGEGDLGDSGGWQRIAAEGNEIDTCATSTGGKVYDIGTAADDTASNSTSANTTALKETLDDIAADIKAWAGYEKARNVTN